VNSYRNESQDPGGSQTRVKIEKWVYGGDALARVDGQVMLLPQALPGELVELGEVVAHKGYSAARVAGVVEAAPERVEAPCPVFGSCGGCHYQMAPYEYQLARKVEIVREVMKRQGKFDAPEEIPVLQGEPWGYRNRTQFHTQDARWGFKREGSHDFVALEGDCPISAPRINETLTALRSMSRDRRWPGFLQSLELFTNGSEVLLNVRETAGGRGVNRSFFEWCAGQVKGLAGGSVDYDAAGFRYRVSHGAFFQVNRFLVEALVEEALWQAEGEAAVELYAGVGLFSLPLAKRIAKVSAVESSRAAVRDLEFNATRAGVALETAVSGAAEWLAGRTQSPDFILLDPPRSGAGKAVILELIRLSPRRITLVSCDPPTQARDLSALLGAGYRLRRLALADLFPQTYHIETVAHLER
jgi:23S rRNA (uracil1939-C5)-methyltransferase